VKGTREKRRSRKGFDQSAAQIERRRHLLVAEKDKKKTTGLVKGLTPELLAAESRLGGPSVTGSRHQLKKSTCPEVIFARQEEKGGVPEGGATINVVSDVVT